MDLKSLKAKLKTLSKPPTPEIRGVPFITDDSKKVSISCRYLKIHKERNKASTFFCTLPKHVKLYLEFHTYKKDGKTYSTQSARFLSCDGCLQRLVSKLTIERDT